MSERLFENTVPREENGGTFEPIDLDDFTESVTVVWGDDMLPIEWLFKKEGRGRLIAYAIREIADGDPIYYNKSTLGDKADVSRHSCHRHIDDLVTLGIYQEFDKEDSHARYRPNPDSHLLRALYTANRAAEEYGSNPL